MKIRYLPLLLTLAVIGCATAQTQRPADLASPGIDITLTSPIFFGGGTHASVTLDIDVTNRAKVPITLRRVELESPGMAQYTLLRHTRTFSEQIPPGETRTVTVFPTAVTNVRNPAEPLAVRAILEFEAAGNTWREVTMQRTH